MSQKDVRNFSVCFHSHELLARGVKVFQRDSLGFVIGKHICTRVVVGRGIHQHITKRSRGIHQHIGKMYRGGFTNIQENVYEAYCLISSTLRSISLQSMEGDSAALCTLRCITLSGMLGDYSANGYFTIIALLST